MRGGDEIGGFGERQGIEGGGRNQMVVLHNPAPQGWLSKTRLLGQDSVTSRVLHKTYEHMNSIFLTFIYSITFFS